jgi:hypothetical protein
VTVRRPMLDMILTSTVDLSETINPTTVRFGDATSAFSATGGLAAATAQRSDRRGVAFAPAATGPLVIDYTTIFCPPHELMEKLRHMSLCTSRGSLLGETTVIQGPPSKTTKLSTLHRSQAVGSSAFGMR